MAPRRVFVAATIRNGRMRLQFSFFAAITAPHIYEPLFDFLSRQNSQHIFLQSNTENNEQTTTGTHLKARNSVRVSVQIALVSFIHCNQSVKIFCFSPTVAVLRCCRTHELNDAKYQLVFHIENARPDNTVGGSCDPWTLSGIALQCLMAVTWSSSMRCTSLPCLFIPPSFAISLPSIYATWRNSVQRRPGCLRANHNVGQRWHWSPIFFMFFSVL